MPVNNNIASNIPFLISYTPFGFPNIEVTDISQMVDVDIPNSLLMENLEYEIGTDINPVYTVTVKNITINAVIEAIFYFSDAVLQNQEGLKENNLSTIKKFISPGNTLLTQFVLNKQTLNSSANYEKYPFNFSLKLRNVPNGTIVLRNP